MSEELLGVISLRLDGLEYGRRFSQFLLVLLQLSIHRFPQLLQLPKYEIPECLRAARCMSSQQVVQTHKCFLKLFLRLAAFKCHLFIPKEPHYVSATSCAKDLALELRNISNMYIPATQLEHPKVGMTYIQCSQYDRRLERDHHTLPQHP